jgi:hypothetical protein
MQGAVLARRPTIGTSARLEAVFGKAIAKRQQPVFDVGIQVVGDCQAVLNRLTRRQPTPLSKENVDAPFDDCSETQLIHAGHGHRHAHVSAVGAWP